MTWEEQKSSISFNIISFKDCYLKGLYMHMMLSCQLEKARKLLDYSALHVTLMQQHFVL
jgi:hypothetical protein